MHYLALATDYDGTLATDGQAKPATLAALGQLRESGRQLIMVTGRQLDDLETVFPHVNWFDCIVAENGALLYFPSTKDVHLLGDRPPDAFIQHLRDQGVTNLGVGHVIVATWEPHHTIVLETIQSFGLNLQVILNKGAVMVLPAGIDKATGLRAALDRMNLSLDNVVGVGDAENDFAFLEICGFSVAVANALPTVKEQVDWVTTQPRGEGVTELIDELIASDLERLAER